MRSIRSNPDRRSAPGTRRLRVIRFKQRDQLRPRHHRIHLGQKLFAPRRLTKPLQTRWLQASAAFSTFNPARLLSARKCIDHSAISPKVLRTFLNSRRQGRPTLDDRLRERPSGVGPHACNRGRQRNTSVHYGAGKKTAPRGGRHSLVGGGGGNRTRVRKTLHSRDYMLSRIIVLSPRRRDGQATAGPVTLI